MALMYPWATKEYLLWNMSLGQIIMYHNIGMDKKNGNEKKSDSLVGKSYEELKKIKEDMIKEGIIPKEQSDEELKRKYGNIEEVH